MIQQGEPKPLGAVPRDGGVNFAVFSAGAEALELCLFDDQGREQSRCFLPETNGEVWYGFVPGIGAGQHYGFRAHGPWVPREGLRFNPAKLLLDPYARRLAGSFCWSPAVFDFRAGCTEGAWNMDETDSAPFVPRSVVSAGGAPPRPGRQRIPWSEAVIYELNVRGFTMRHPDLSEAERGRLRGLANGQILEYLRALGVTSVELMPVQSWIDEEFLARRGLRNFWGYNPVQFFVVDQRLAGPDPATEFRQMIDAMHDAGLEVILDVVYNHTGEGDEQGPTLSFRGLDNRVYYRSKSGNPGRYVNDTGCGNTLNTPHPTVQRLVIDSLIYWHRRMGVDGFRFDLATVLGRGAAGFDPGHPLLQRLETHDELSSARLIAEPWDPAPGGYQLGNFPPRWSEWNDRYRDTLRRVWRGDRRQLGNFSRRLHGSADIFEASGRTPLAGINFITSHDGFTLQDLVSYRHKHNHANGEHNRDGHSHNYSCNHGVEGLTDEPSVLRKRFRHRLNLVATLLFSQGTPMLLAGDEFGNSQGGNNNAYAQDNETGWLDWPLLESNRNFLDAIRELLRLRKALPILRQPRFLHGPSPCDDGWVDIRWLRPDGDDMQRGDWTQADKLTMLLSRRQQPEPDSRCLEAIALLFNASAEPAVLHLPAPGTVGPQGAEWAILFSSAETEGSAGEGRFALCAHSMLLAGAGAAKVPGASYTTP